MIVTFVLAWGSFWPPDMLPHPHVEKPSEEPETHFVCYWDPNAPADKGIRQCGAC